MATQPSQRRALAGAIGHEQFVEERLSLCRQERRESVQGLLVSSLPRSGHHAFDDGNAGPYEPLALELLRERFDQHRRAVVLERPLDQPCSDSISLFLPFQSLEAEMLYRAALMLPYGLRSRPVFVEILGPGANLIGYESHRFPRCVREI